MRSNTFIIAAFAAFLLSGCGERADYEETNEGDGGARHERAFETARDNLSGLSYEDQHGSEGCTDDCSGHDAGYQWAQDNQIEDAGECGGESQSFQEGCEAYANDLDDAADDAEHDNSAGDY